jgi:surfeit locus 1 family protein
MMTIRFRPSLIGTIAVVLLCPLFIRLGFWQLSRAEEKHKLQAYYTQQSQFPVIKLETLPDYVFKETDLHWRSVTILGHYLDNFQLLLDNQTHNGRIGYAVFTPFNIANSQQILWVNRGWIPIVNYDRSALPPNLEVDTTSQRIQGTLSPLPPALFQLGEESIETLRPQILRLQTFDLTKIKKYTGIQALPYMLRLDGGDNKHFVQEWTLPGTGEEKHYGYAFQWFSFAIAVIIIYLIMGFKRYSSLKKP